MPSRLRQTVLDSRPGSNCAKSFVSTVEKAFISRPNAALQRELVRRSGTMAIFALFARHKSEVAPGASKAPKRERLLPNARDL